jgi:hypothetical protein
MLDQSTRTQHPLIPPRHSEDLTGINHIRVINAIVSRNLLIRSSIPGRNATQRISLLDGDGVAAARPGAGATAVMRRAAGAAAAGAAVRATTARVAARPAAVSALLEALLLASSPLLRLPALSVLLLVVSLVSPVGNAVLQLRAGNGADDGTDDAAGLGVAGGLAAELGSAKGSGGTSGQGAHQASLTLLGFAAKALLAIALLALAVALLTVVLLTVVVVLALLAVWRGRLLVLCAVLVVVALLVVGVGGAALLLVVVALLGRVFVVFVVVAAHGCVGAMGSRGRERSDG